MEEPKEPRHLGVLRVLATVLLIIGIVLIVLGVGVVRQSSNFGGSRPTPALFVPGIFAAFFSIPCFVIGFSAKIGKMHMEKIKYMQELNKETMTDIASNSMEQIKYIQEKNKETMTDIVSNTADIASEGITKTTRAVKKGLKDDENATKFCKHCGEKIDADSRFCKRCGEEL